MNPIIFASTGQPQTAFVIAAIAVFLFNIFVFLVIWASRYAKVGPDEVMVISGRKYVCVDEQGKQHVAGFRIVKGGGTFVWPVYEKAQVLSLKPVSFDLDLPRIFTLDGNGVRVQCKAQVKIKGDDISIAMASEALLGKQADELKEIAGQIVESALRSFIGARRADEIIQTRSRLADQLQDAIAPQLARVGLMPLSFSIRDVEQTQLPAVT